MQASCRRHAGVVMWSRRRREGAQRPRARRRRGRGTTLFHQLWETVQRREECLVVWPWHVVMTGERERKLEPTRARERCVWADDPARSRVVCGREERAPQCVCVCVCVFESVHVARRPLVVERCAVALGGPNVSELVMLAKLPKLYMWCDDIDGRRGTRDRHGERDIYIAIYGLRPRAAARGRAQSGCQGRGSSRTTVPSTWDSRFARPKRLHAVGQGSWP